MSHGFSTQIVGNVGMYYACYKLSVLGWNVMPTARNARGIDVVAYPESIKNFLGIQVKSLSGRTPVPLGTSNKYMGDLWIIVNCVRPTAKRPTPNCFILYPREVKRLAKGNLLKDGTMAYWLNAPDYDKEKFKENWGRLDEALAKKSKR